MSRSSKVLIVLLIGLGLAYYWLLVNAGPNGIAARQISLSALRSEAERISGKKPTEITFALLATRRVPSASLAAGTGLRQVTAGIIAWRIATPKGSIVLDSGLSAQDAEAMGYEDFDQAAKRTVDSWMDGADQILFTHAHIDHVGGFLDHPNFDKISPKALITPGMLRGVNALWRENARHIAKTRALAPIEAIAPGVVVMQTPGHTPASQMVYVQLASGREYLLTGDTASLAANFENGTPRSRLVADIMAPEDRPAVIGWVKGLQRLQARYPALVMLPSHDADWLIGNAAELGISGATSAQSGQSSR